MAPHRGSPAAAQTAAAGQLPRAAPQLRLLLRLPRPLEQEFWDSRETRRYLFIADAIACAVSATSAATAIGRMVQGTGARSPWEVAGLFIATAPGALRWLFNLAVMTAAYAALALVPLLLMLVWPRTYYRHRWALALTNRLVRLVWSSASLLQPEARLFLARSIASRLRSRQDPPGRVLAVNVLHPVAFWMQQANFVLPWRWALLLQGTNLAAALAWSAELPCWLRRLQLRAEDTCVPWQERAVLACEQLQAAAALVRVGLGDPSALLLPSTCTSLGSVQMLQVFASIVCLLVLPLGVLYLLERWLKCRFLAVVRGMTRSVVSSAGDGRDRGGGGSSSSSSSVPFSGHVHEGASERSAAAAAAGGGASALGAWLSGGVELADDAPALAAHLLCVLVAVSALAMAWAVAEVFHESCAAGAIGRLFPSCLGD